MSRTFKKNLSRAILFWLGSIALTVILLLLVPAVYAGDGIVHKKPGTELVKDSYIVLFHGRESNPAERANELARTHGGEVQRVYRHALIGAHFEMTAGQARGMALNPHVARVQQEGLAYVVGDQANPTWGIDRIDQRDLPLDNNYHWEYDGTGVTAFIMDTGIRTTHVDFGGRASWGIDCTGEGQSDGHGHGTHVAGTVGSATYGVAKNVTLVAVKICNSGGSCPDADILCGIDYATGQKQASPSTPMVANMSIGGSYDQVMNDAVTNSVATGIYYAVAAGNSSADACSYSPSSTPDAYTLGATTSADARSSFSNYGTCVDVFAPGSSILSTYNSSDTATTTMSGTSMASPHACGAGALVFDEYPTWTPYQVMAELDARATLGRLSNVGSGSPNALLYTLGVGPDFSVSCSPSNLSIQQGGSDATTCTVTALGGYTGTVDLDCSGNPAGIGCAFSPNPVNPTGESTLTITVDLGQSTGTYNFDVVGDDGTATRTSPMSVTVTPEGQNGPQDAVWNVTYQAPACLIAGSECDSLALLDGRDGVGPEPNQPNTLDGCADGTSGTYHSDESNDRIVIKTLDGYDFTVGATVQIDAMVWAWSTASSDALDLYYAADANNPTWVYVTTILPPGGGAQTLSATYTLPDGALQAVRANFRYGGSVGPCTTGSYDDHDDLVFAVGTGAPECDDDSDCSDGLWCNGAETCNLTTGQCEAGTPVVCDDGVACTDDSCNEGTDSCDNVVNDANCSNGLFCDGAETCHATLGCQAGTPVNCNDGVGCTADSCNEATDQCDYEENDLLCDNGLFCDGTEVCNAITGCQPGTVSCCNGCNEAADVCECPVEGCEDDLFCNGVETCNVDTGSCKAGSDPCPGQICDEANDVCTGSADFESGADGWTTGADTCTTGSFVVGSPDATSWQVSGGNPGNAFFTQLNTGGVGIDDVDGGTCEALSPTFDCTGQARADISLDYFHGQRDAGDDPGDGFTIEVLSDGVAIDTIVSIGDVTSNPAWTNVSTSVNNPGHVQIRVRATDAVAAGDIVEAGIDNVTVSCVPGCPFLSTSDAQMFWQQIALKDSEDDCPCVNGWVGQELFGEFSEITDEMRRFCIYTREGEVTDGHLTNLREAPGLRCGQPERAAVSPACGLGTSDFAAALLETLQGELIENAGGLQADISGTPSVRLALLDTAPTMERNPKCLLTDPWSCGEECPPSTDFSPHGPTLGAFADTLLCKGSEPCRVQVTSQLALRYDSRTLNPNRRPTSTLFGYVGTLSDLASAIWGQFDKAKDAGTEKLILNLSVGWHPRFGGYEETVVDDMPLDVQAVYLAIQAAVRDNSPETLVIAPAGNKFDDYDPDDTGPLLPAAWESHSSCETGDTACQNDYRPLVYAAAGIDRNCRLLSNARPESTPPLLAYGDHAMVERSATLTGSSVATLVVSAAAAAAWLNPSAPTLPAAEVMNRVHNTGLEVDPTTDFCLDILNGCQDPDRVDARGVSVCRAYHNCTGSQCFQCPPGPQCPPDPEFTIVDFSDVVFDELDIDSSEDLPLPPSKRFRGIWAQPWLYPHTVAYICSQPGPNLCPNCSVGQTSDQSQWTLYGEIDGFYEIEKLSEFTLACDQKTFGLDQPATGPFKVIFSIDECGPPNVANLELSAATFNGRSVSAPVYVIEGCVKESRSDCSPIE